MLKKYWKNHKLSLSVAAVSIGLNIVAKIMYIYEDDVEEKDLVDQLVERNLQNDPYYSDEINIIHF
jgi:Tfp pilus assembly PilM family ATPase